MTKIVLMSDSHGDNLAIDRVLLANKDADYFYHMGDLCDDPQRYPCICFLKGNNDYCFDMPEQLVSTIEHHRIWMTHSHRFFSFQMNRRKLLAYKANELKCDMVFYGHTHLYDDSIVDGVHLLNPGSLQYNRDGSDPGYMVILLDENGMKITRKFL